MTIKHLTRIFVLFALLALSVAAHATTITVASTTVNDVRWGGTVATLRVYASTTFLTSTGQMVIGTAVGSNSFYKTIPCTISGTVLSIPQFTIDSTTDSPDQPNGANYTFVFYDSKGVRRDIFMSSVKVPISLGTTITTGQLRLYNAALPGPFGPSYYTADQVNALLNNGGGIRFLNGSTETTQNFLTGSIGSNFSITSSAGVHTFFIPSSSATARGLLTSSDWSTFNIASTAESNAASFASLSAAISGIGGTSTTLVISTAVSVPSSLAVPTNITLRFTGTGSVTIASGQTLTINGPIDAAERQIFSGSGTVTFGAGLTRELYAEWWGAKADGATNSTTAINAALTAMPATGGRLRLLAGTYQLDKPVRLKSDNVTIAGAGRSSTTLKTSFGGGFAIVVAPSGSGYPDFPTGASLVSGTSFSHALSNNKWINLRDAGTMELDGLTAFTAELYYKTPADITSDGVFLSSSGRRGISEPVKVSLTLAAQSSSPTSLPTCRLNIGGTERVVTSSVAGLMTGGVTHHIAVSYDGTALRLFFDGALVGSTAVTGTVRQNYSEDITLGPSIQEWPDGAILTNPPASTLVDSVRVSKVARYTSAFTPGGIAFTSDSNTLCLLNFDAADIDGILVRGQTNAGDVWFPYRTNALTQTNTETEIRDLKIDGNGKVGGIFIGIALNGNYQNLSITGVRTGMYFFNNSFLCKADNIKILLVSTPQPRFSLGAVSASGVNYYSHIQAQGGPLGVVISNSGATFTNAYVTGVSMKIGAIFKAGANGGATLINFDWADEETDANLEYGMMFSGMDSVVMSGGTNETGLTNHPVPAFLIDGGANLTFTGVRVQTNGGAASVFKMLTPPSSPVLFNNSFLRNVSGTMPPLSDVANAIQVIDSGGLRAPSVTVTTTYSVSNRDFTVRANATSAPFSATLPTAVNIIGKRFTIKKTDASANAVTIATTSSQTIDGSATYSLATQNKYVTVESDGAGWNVVGNN